MTSRNDHGDKAKAFIAVGSNVDPEYNVTASLISLTRKVRVIGSSTFYRTEPIGTVDQPAFVNGVWLIETELKPMQIRDDLLRPIEQELGRVRSENKFASRVIDLDLVLYDDLIVNEGGICLPHRDVTRPFVHIPILELLEDCPGDIRNSIVTLLPAPATKTPGLALRELTRTLRVLLSP